MRKGHTSSENGRRKMPPARTPEAREQQMISLAFDLVEKRLLEGTATSQETTHFLKLATTKAQLEKQVMEKQKELYEAKVEALKSTKRTEELFEEAMKAMRTYKGQEDEDEDDDY